MALTLKEKELVAVGASVAAGCNDEAETVTSNEPMKESVATAAGDCGCGGDC